jgi:hypothetical protein
MTISFDNDKLKRVALYAIWFAVATIGAFAALKYLPSAFIKQPAYAIVKVSELIKEEQARSIKDDFIFYRDSQNKSEDIENAARNYYARIKSLANQIAGAENLIIFDEGAVIGLPANAVDITPFIRRELNKQAPQQPLINQGQ